MAWFGVFKKLTAFWIRSVGHRLESMATCITRAQHAFEIAILHSRYDWSLQCRLGGFRQQERGQSSWSPAGANPRTTTRGPSHTVLGEMVAPLRVYRIHAIFFQRFMMSTSPGISGPSVLRRITKRFALRVGKPKHRLSLMERVGSRRSMRVGQDEERASKEPPDEGSHFVTARESVAPLGSCLGRLCYPRGHLSLRRKEGNH